MNDIYKIRDLSHIVTRIIQIITSKIQPVLTRSPFLSSRQAVIAVLLSTITDFFHWGLAPDRLDGPLHSGRKCSKDRRKYSKYGKNTNKLYSDVYDKKM